jgi:hypothetical protein
MTGLTDLHEILSDTLKPYNWWLSSEIVNGVFFKPDERTDAIVLSLYGGGVAALVERSAHDLHVTQLRDARTADERLFGRRRSRQIIWA